MGRQTWLTRRRVVDHMRACSCGCPTTR